MTITRFKHDGLNRRIVKDDELADPDVDYDYFYNESWQIVEVRKDDDTDPWKQMVWHPYYIDALALTHDDDNTSGSNIYEIYHTHDANFNVTSSVVYLNSVTAGFERYEYDAYGKVTVLDFDFTSDADGDPDFENFILFAGYRLDLESGLYGVRNRFLHPTLGRWMQRDPMDYVDGMSVYEYALTNPPTITDPSGLCGCNNMYGRCLQSCRAGCDIAETRTHPGSCYWRCNRLFHSKTTKDCCKRGCLSVILDDDDPCGCGMWPPQFQWECLCHCKVVRDCRSYCWHFRENSDRYAVCWYSCMNAGNSKYPWYPEPCEGVAIELEEKGWSWMDIQKLCACMKSHIDHGFFKANCSECCKLYIRVGLFPGYEGDIVDQRNCEHAFDCFQLRPVRPVVMP